MKYFYQSESLSLRRMEDHIDEFMQMTKWLTNESVLTYYGGITQQFDLQAIVKKYQPRINGLESVVPCVIEYQRRDIGYLQYYPIDPQEYQVEAFQGLRHYGNPVGIDLFIGETEFWNKGIGTELLQLTVSYLFENQKADAVVIDPMTWNTRAIRCYEKTGFKSLGIIEKRERYDGELKDNLIMAIDKSDWMRALD